MKIEYVGKCLLVEIENKKILVVGDMHFGYGDSIRNSGFIIQDQLGRQVREDFDSIFGEIGKVDGVVLLGDLKHVFGKIMRDEWKDVLGLVSYLKNKSDKVVVVKGNHDKILEPILKDKDVEVLDYYCLGEVCFMHGDKAWDEENAEVKNAKTWILGHGYPAVKISDGVRKESYKCFLEGKFKGRRIVIVPSFFPFNEGTDPRDYDMKMVWNFKLDKFEVRIVDGLENRGFGKFGDLK
jgi:putative SbcD/Mre11-related phosphoesterase